jgi:hypothetical protein
MLNMFCVNLVSWRLLLIDCCCAGDFFYQFEVCGGLHCCGWFLMGRLLHGVWSEGMLRMSMELCGMCGGLLWLLFGSTGQDLLTRLATVPAGRLVCVATTPQLMILTTELKCSIKSP